MLTCQLLWRSVPVDKALRYLALAAKAGKLRIGELDIKASIQRGKGSMLVLSADAGKNTVSRAEKQAVNLPMKVMQSPFSMEEIASAIGHRNPVALVLIRDDGLARAFAEAINME